MQIDSCIITLRILNCSTFFILTFKQMDSYEQKYLFRKFKVDFKEGGILYTYGNIFDTKEIAIDYEEVLFWKITREAKTDKFNLFVCIASGVMVIKSILGVYDNPLGIYKGLLPLSGIFFIVFLVVTLLGRTKYVYIELANGGVIKLLDRNKPSLAIFLGQLATQTKQYLRAKYTDLESSLSTEVQLENLFWLKQIKVISKPEYEKFKSILMDQQPQRGGEFRF